jgi:pyruvate formate lyase activating enzyme
MPERSLVVGGVTPFTTIDFPGRLAAVVFCQGCPWRCTYCHNPHLLPSRVPGARPWAEVQAWLETRRGLLDGVVFSGGEPLLQRGLAAAVSTAREMEFAVGLHTGGVYPERLADLLPLLDWVGFDVKAPFDDYGRVTGAGGGHAARASLQHLLASGRCHELRCTVDPALLDAQALGRMAKDLASLGARKLVLQGCRRDGVGLGPIDPERIRAVTDTGIEVELRGA